MVDARVAHHAAFQTHPSDFDERIVRTRMAGRGGRARCSRSSRVDACLE
jgi:hypothetical protein